MQNIATKGTGPLAQFRNAVLALRLGAERDEEADLWLLAKLLRDSAAPLRDLVEHGEGEVRLAARGGKVMLEARTPTFNLVRRVE